jgi:hypothetical protein
MENYKQKYEKYKQKYLDLKNLVGGHKFISSGSRKVVIGNFSHIGIPLDTTTANEIIERPLVSLPDRTTFIPYRSPPLKPHTFILSNTFFGCSLEIYNNIKSQIEILPSDSWIMCVRYNDAIERTEFGDCQIGISGSVNFVDSINGTIDFKQSVVREIKEETGLNPISTDFENIIMSRTDVKGKKITYMVTSLNMENCVPISTDMVEVMPDKNNDIAGLKVWCVPYIPNDKFSFFMEQLNRHDTLKATEKDISSLVFIQKENLLQYLVASLSTNPCFQTSIRPEIPRSSREYIPPSSRTHETTRPYTPSSRTHETTRPYTPPSRTNETTRPYGSQKSRADNDLNWRKS